MPVTLEDVANQIAEATRIFTDAPQAKPGEWVHVQVTPGFAPAIPATSTLQNVTLAGTLGTLGPLNATLSGVWSLH